MIDPPQPLPGTHLAAVDCNGCGTVVMAVPQQVDVARCTACWVEVIEERFGGDQGHS